MTTHTYVDITNEWPGEEGKDAVIITRASGWQQERMFMRSFPKRPPGDTTPITWAREFALFMGFEYRDLTDRG